MTKKYDKEFKLQSVRLIQEEGKSVAQVAREMACMRTRYCWIAEFKNAGNQAFPGSGQLKPEDKMLTSSRSEFAIWKRRTTS
ncbi:transposase [Paenibacillus larvae]|nr:transposase [Paenibacillus larvae]MDT2248591.1 transposase [Paenibacillus larvae]